MSNLTDRMIQSLSPPKGERLTASDDKVRGLSIFASYGGTKTFYFRYKTPQGRQKRVRIASTYKHATHVHINRSVKRMKLRRGETYKILSVDEKRNRVELTGNGKTLTFRPAKYKLSKGTLTLYEKDRIVLHKADRIRFTRGRDDRSLDNNDLGTVKAVSASSMTIELDKGKTITLPMKARELSHIDHGWANTGHAFQGKTVADAVIVMPSRDSHLTTLATLYVGASRHKDSVAIITDDIGKLTANLEKRFELKASEVGLFKPSKPNEKTTSSRDDKVRPSRGPRNPMTIHGPKNKPTRLQELFGRDSAKPRDRARTKSKDLSR